MSDEELDPRIRALIVERQVEREEAAWQNFLSEGAKRLGGDNALARVVYIAKLGKHARDMFGFGFMAGTVHTLDVAAELVELDAKAGK